MDYIVIIAIAIAILASTINDAQKRRRRAQNTPQEPDIQPMHDEVGRPAPQPMQTTVRPKVQRPQRQPQQAMPEEVRAAIEYAQQRAAKSRKAQRQHPQPTKPVTVAKESKTAQPAATNEQTRQGSAKPFDIERAIIYSEILQPKYKEYE